MPTRNFPFKDRLFALPVQAMLLAFFYLPLNFLQQSSSKLAQNKLKAGLPPSTVSFVLCFPFKNTPEATPL